MKPLSVYVHIPFCTVKCGYCDFNAYAGMDSLKDAYAAAVLREIAAWRHAFAGREIATIGFGGGTPGELAGAHIGAIIAAVRAEAPFTADIEISLEANPGTVDGPYLQRLRDAGVNRISFGAQSFDAAELAFLDRIHSPEAIHAAIALARAAAFPSIGLDLIYGIPGQTRASWTSSLEAAVALPIDHLSLYALTVEDGTPLGDRVERGEVFAPDPDTLAEMYDLASDRLAAAGFAQYEISNWARPGLESRHNQVYWLGGDYLGVGAGAHGYLGGERYEVVAHPRAYVDIARRLEPTAATSPNTVLRRYRPTRETAMTDWVALRLRLLRGFAPADFADAFGDSVEAVFGPVLRECAAAGVLEVGPSIRLTPKGRLLHGEVAVRLIAHLAVAPAR